MTEIIFRAVPIDERSPEPLSVHHVLIDSRLPMVAIYRNHIDKWWSLGFSEAKPLDKGLTHWLERVKE